MKDQDLESESQSLSPGLHYLLNNGLGQWFNFCDF